jgi:hypothetical protein
MMAALDDFASDPERLDTIISEKWPEIRESVMWLRRRLRWGLEWRSLKRSNELQILEIE